MKIKSLTILALFLCLAVTASFGQSWSKDQQEVWKAVDKLWAVWIEGDFELHRSLIDENYRGWGVKDPAPYTKQEVRPWAEHNMKNNPIKIYKIHPLAIDIYDDIALVFYSYQTLSVKADGTDMPVTGKWLDVYRKNNGNWLLIADSGGDM